MSPHSPLRLDDTRFSTKKIIPKIILGVAGLALAMFGGVNLLNAVINSVNAIEGGLAGIAIVVPEGTEEDDEAGDKDVEEEEGDTDADPDSLESGGEETKEEEESGDPETPSEGEEEKKDEKAEENAKITAAIQQSLDRLPKNGFDHTLNHVSGEATTNYQSLRAYGTDTLPSYYNSRAQAFAANIVTKDQNTESLCWAYACSTVLEYLVAKGGVNTTVAPKHFDYQMVSASEAYKDSNVANIYNDRAVATLQAAGASNPQRHLGSSANMFQVFTALTNPLGIMSEADFSTAIKNSDSRISGIATYSDIWDIDGAKTSILVNGAYTVKQNYADINNAAATHMIITEATNIYIGAGESDSKTAVVNSLKNAILNYGAVEVGTFYDTDRNATCGQTIVQKDDDGNNYIDEDGRYHITHIIIDRSTSASSPCPSDSGHAVTLVGWDDSFTYTDGGEEKHGAFIVQNSYGDVITEETSQGPISYIMTDYMAYSSSFDAIVISAVESVDDFDHNYTVEDYQSPTLTPGAYDLIYEFSSNGKEQLKEISYNTLGYSSINNDVYVSTTGSNADFVKVGSFTAYGGINKYIFPTTLTVNGKFAIKITQKNAQIDDMDRSFNILSVRTNNDTEEESETGEVTWIQGQDYVYGSGQNLVFRIDYPMADFLSLSIDDTLVNESYYSVAEGSTVITLDSSYVDSVIGSSDQSQHTIKANFTNNRSVATTFTATTDGDDPTPHDKSNNAYLSSIEVKYKVGGVEKTAELDPEFVKTTYKYDALIPDGFDENAYEDKSSLVSVTLEDENADAVSENVQIANNIVEVKIKVTAEDGTTTKNYSVVVYYGTAPDIPDTSGTTPSVPNTGFMVNRKNGDVSSGTTTTIFLPIGVVAGVLFALVVFSRKYQITKRSHVKGEIELL